MSRKSYPSDVSDGEWEFVLPYLTLMTADAPQRQHDLREVFNTLRWLARTGSPVGSPCGFPLWVLPGAICPAQGAPDLPPWEVVYSQTQRWINAQVFEAGTLRVRP